MQLTAENYHSPEVNKEYMSVSMFKMFDACEASAMAKLRGEYNPFQADALLFGQAVHHWNQYGEIDTFIDQHPEMYSTRTKSIYAKFEGIHDCIQALKTDKVCTMALQGQKEVIFTASMFGTPWKIMIDAYNPDYGMFSDLKTMKDIDSKYWDGKRYVSFVEHYGYDIQMSVYAEVERLATGRLERLEPHIVVVTKQSPPRKKILTGFLQTADEMLIYVEDRMQRILQVKAGQLAPSNCGKCDWCAGQMEAEIVDYREIIA